MYVCGNRMYVQQVENKSTTQQATVVVIHIWFGGHVLRGIRTVMLHRRDVNVCAETSCNLRIDPLLPWSLLAPSQFYPSLLGVASTESALTHRGKHLRDYVCTYCIST